MTWSYIHPNIANKVKITWWLIKYVSYLKHYLPFSIWFCVEPWLGTFGGITKVEFSLEMDTNSSIPIWWIMSGSFGRQTPNRKRFIVSQNCLLIVKLFFFFSFISLILPLLQWLPGQHIASRMQRFRRFLHRRQTPRDRKQNPSPPHSSSLSQIKGCWSLQIHY